MTKTFRTCTTTTMIAVLLASIGITPAAAAATPPLMAGPNGLSLSQLKVTGDEFIVLQNNTVSPIDASNYWLTSFNNVNPLAKGVSSSSQQLPAVTLLPSAVMLLSSEPSQTCGASVAGDLSLSLTDSGGFLQLASTIMSPNGAVTQTAGDYVSWSSSASGVIQNYPSSTKSQRAAYYRYRTGNGFAWQLADQNPQDSCQLNVLVAGGSSSSSAVTPLNLVATSPPATILGVEGGEGDPKAVLPLADIGLSAPQISELLPNPVGTGNDNRDEFIELYNPNPKPFDLTGFSMQTGMTRLKVYEFAAGTMLAPNGFTAFRSELTKLSLSNTSSQADLVDPFGKIITSSQPYKNAKEGVAWANAKGSWQWTVRLTPGAANIIQQPVSKKKSKAAKRGTSRLVSKGLNGLASKDANVAGAHPEEEQTSVVHFWVLALVGSAALLYGAYEYRRDIIYRLRRCISKLGAWRAARAPSGGRPGD